MFVTVFMALVLGMVSAVTVTTTLTRNKDSRFQLDRLQARSLAEAILDAAQKQILERTANFDDPFEDSLTASGTVTIGGENYSWTGEDLTPSVYPGEVDQSGWHTVPRQYNVNEPNSPLQDVYTRVVRIYPGSDIENGVLIADAASRLRRTIEVQRFPLLDLAMGSNTDLEYLPGPTSSVMGKVHANGDIYLGVGSNKTLSFDTDSLTCTGEIFRKRKNDGSTTGGTVRIKNSSNDYKSLRNDRDYDYWNDPEAWANYSTNRWDGVVQTGSHGVLNLNFPDVGSISNNGHFRNNADLVFANDLVYHVQNGVEFDITAQVSTAVSQSSTDLYDAREEKYVPLTEIDLSDSLLTNYIESVNQDSNPDNDIHQIYAYRHPNPEPANWDPAEASNWFEGIRLVNGESLPADMLIVSENPIYVQGDFNTTDFGTPDQKTAAVISDAVNLLSNSWSDEREDGDSFSDIDNASETTFNMAMVTGDVPTPNGGGTYSGGFENLPRFHERWSGVNCNINGSFLRLFESRQATENWGKSGVYKPPVRNWGYDEGLLNSSPLRHLFPQAVSIDRLVWEEGQPILPGT